jgi:hypothetical protein
MNTKHINTLIAVLAVAGVGLIAFVIGVNGGSGAQTPPGTNNPPAVEKEVPPAGVDQRLYELAEKHAEKLERESAPGPDTRLYELAKQYSDRMESQPEPAPGPDQRLYELAERFAAEQRR